jgi:hypothetical protein
MEEETISFHDESSPEECDQVLMTAHGILLRVLDLQVQHFNLEWIEEELGKCVEDFQAVWKKPTAEGSGT